MGIAFDKMVELLGLCQVEPGARVLDIGCSNIHTLTVDGLIALIRRYNDVYEPAPLRAWAEHVAAGGAMDPDLGGANGAWLGDVLTRAGLTYRAFDIFDGYNTEHFDLNHEALAAHHHLAFDVVLNFGTTEHLLGQLNAFKVIHEAAAVGAWIIHDLPMTGHLDHGYFCYNPMLFMHLAHANGYEIHSVRFSGGETRESIDAGLLARYSGYDFVRTRRDEGPWLQAPLPTSSILVIFRKVKDAPFRIGLETSTTAGAVHASIAARYDSAPDLAPGAARPTLARVARDLVRAARGQARDLWWRARRREGRGLWSLWGSGAHLDLLLAKYYVHRRIDPPAPFAQQAALDALQRRLLQDDGAGSAPLPDRCTAALDAFPLLNLLEGGAAASPPPLALDGIEADLDPAALRFEALLGAYAAYYRLSTLDRFPPRLEAALLLHATRAFPEDKRFHARIGHIMGQVTPLMAIQRAA